jgi:phosphate transport system protein
MKRFENELSDLRRQLTKMGNLAERMVSQAIDLVSQPHSEALPDAVQEGEQSLDRMQLETDQDAIRLLAVYSPVAANLRVVLSVSRITGALERMGDHAVNMCELVQLWSSKVEVAPLPQLQSMSQIVRTMVADTLQAFVQDDIRKARMTIAHDDMVDSLNDQVIEELLSLNTVKELVPDRANLAGVMAQILIARSLERIADQATNISEEVVYMVKGQDIRHEDSEE